MLSFGVVITIRNVKLFFLKKNRMLSFGVVITIRNVKLFFLDKNRMLSFGVVITLRNVKLFFLEKIECCLLVLSYAFTALGSRRTTI